MTRHLFGDEAFNFSSSLKLAFKRLSQEGRAIIRNRLRHLGLLLDRRLAWWLFHGLLFLDINGCLGGRLCRCFALLLRFFCFLCFFWFFGFSGFLGLLRYLGFFGCFGFFDWLSDCLLVLLELLQGDVIWRNFLVLPFMRFLAFLWRRSWGTSLSLACKFTSIPSSINELSVRQNLRFKFEFEFGGRLLTRSWNGLSVVIHVIVCARVVGLEVAVNGIVVHMSWVDTLLSFAFRADLIATLEFTMAIFKREAHGARPRLIVISLFCRECDVRQVKLHIDSANDQAVTMIQGNYFALLLELVLVVQAIGSQHLDAEIACIIVEEDLGVLARDALWPMRACTGCDMMWVDRNQRTVLRVLGHVAVEMMRDFRKGLHEHVLGRPLHRLLFVWVASGMGC
jgi:hypothetical protein